MSIFPLPPSHDPWAPPPLLSQTIETPAEQEARRLKWKKEGEERKRVDQWYDAFLKRSVDRECKEVVAAERRKREDELARTVDDVLGEQLEAEHAKNWPSDIIRQSYVPLFTEFKKWANGLGLGAMPAQGTTVAAWLVECQLNGVALSELPHIAEAIIFAHNVCRHYLDVRPINAALEFARGVEAEINNTEQEKPNGQS
jgi:hypothetical protein